MSFRCLFKRKSKERRNKLGIKFLSAWIADARFSDSKWLLEIFKPKTQKGEIVIKLPLL